MQITKAEQMNNDQLNGQSREETRTRFNPNDHLMQIKSGGKDGLKDYLPVQWRLVWFRESCPQGTIETEMLHLDLDRETEEDYYGYNSESRRNEKMTRRASGFVVFRAVVKDGKGGIATGTKSEKAASFADYIEKAETGAIGRALAALGYGTQFAPELNEEHRIVDAPVDRPNTPAASAPESNGNGHRPAANTRPAAVNGSRQHSNNPNTASATPTDNEAPATEQQLVGIRKLCKGLDKPEPALSSLTYIQAKDLLHQLNIEWRERNDSRKAS